MIRELLFKVERTAAPAPDELQVQVFSVRAGDATAPRFFGVFYVDTDTAGVFRGMVDRFGPQLWPGVSIYWAGEPVESVPPFAGADKLLALAGKLKLLPST